MPKYQNLSEAITDNQTRKCKIAECFNRRFRVSGYCRKHQIVLTRWGHPEAHAIYKYQYAKEREAVAEIIDLNIDHPGIDGALKTIENILEGAAKGTHVPDAMLLTRLHHIEPKTVLTHVAALVMLHWNGSIIKDTRHLTYVIGAKVIQLQPVGRLLRGPEHRAVGQLLYDGIGAMCLKIAKAAIRRQEEGVAC